MMEKRNRLSTFEDDATAKCIKRCAELHFDIAGSGDPFEYGGAVTRFWALGST